MATETKETKRKSTSDISSSNGSSSGVSEKRSRIVDSNGSLDGCDVIDDIGNDHQLGLTSAERTGPITLNVGGALFTTSLTTLTMEPSSFFTGLLTTRVPLSRDGAGHIFIDRKHIIIIIVISL
jgi:hypothetical protein